MHGQFYIPESNIINDSEVVNEVSVHLGKAARAYGYLCFSILIPGV